MLYAYAVRFDVTENLKKFLVFGLNCNQTVNTRDGYCGGEQSN